MGSCTGNAWAGALEYLELKAKAEFFDVSRLFIYYQERVIERTVKQDAGAEIRNGAKALAKVGYCAESLWPYKASKFAAKPPKSAYADASQHRITEYLRCDTLEDSLQAVAFGLPVVFGFTVYSAFEGTEVARTGTLNMPGQKEKSRGGHAVVLVGYDEDAKRAIVRNSWGAGWGIAGYFTMPYAYLADRRYADDFWTVRK